MVPCFLRAFRQGSVSAFAGKGLASLRHDGAKRYFVELYRDFHFPSFSRLGFIGYSGGPGRDAARDFARVLRQLSAFD